MNRDERITYYCESVYSRVAGWLHPEIANVVRAIGTVQARHGVCGDIVEFGVHHGKFLLLLDALRESDEHTIAVDIFDAQELNPHDQELSRGNLAYLRDNIALLPWSPQIALVARDTLSFRPGDFAGAKFFSVDAGHTCLNAFNDLAVAQDALVPGGIIALDDFFHPCWPGVTEAFYRFMRCANRRIKPLMFYKNKLFLTTSSEHPTLLSEYRELMTSIIPTMVVTQYCDHDCLVMSWDGL